MTDKAHAYIGCKIIQALPHEQDGQPGYRVFYPDGYVSWSPKHVFEEAYRRVSPGEARLIAFGSDDLVEAALEEASDDSTCSEDCFTDHGVYDAKADDVRCTRCDKYRNDWRKAQPPPGGP